MEEVEEPVYDVENFRFFYLMHFRMEALSQNRYKSQDSGRRVSFAMVLHRIFHLLTIAAGVSYAGHVALLPLPVWPGTPLAGVNNRYFHDIEVPMAVPELTVAETAYHSHQQPGINVASAGSSAACALPRTACGSAATVLTVSGRTNSPGIIASKHGNAKGVSEAVRIRSGGDGYENSTNWQTGINKKSNSGNDGAGVKHQLNHYDDQLQKDVKVYNTNHKHDTAQKTNYGIYNDAGHQAEKGGQKKLYYDEAKHLKEHQEKGKSRKAAKFGEKKGHKRGHKTKGYHNKFHKDEYHKEHRFYDDLHKSGHHDKYGDHHAHYGKKDGKHKKGRKHNSGHEEKDFGKKGYTDKGHFEEEHKGHNAHGGHESYHKHNKDYHKNKDSQGGKQVGYAQAKH
ncbi:hypothetical protein NQ317_010813 [Molorchus minor]|uniref:Uncharacterized protein n=1 Tax=Molorchus minor TaxID=1323400 RepID=A0ABQ9JTA4_9CUCU|nr:hypothetical protein NQ317_010813 [Molorchus minor]